MVQANVRAHGQSQDDGLGRMSCLFQPVKPQSALFPQVRSTVGCGRVNEGFAQALREGGP